MHQEALRRALFNKDREMAEAIEHLQAEKDAHHMEVRYGQPPVLNGVLACYKRIEHFPQFRFLSLFRIPTQCICPRSPIRFNGWSFAWHTIRS